MGWEAPWHWVILAIIVIALFGYKKLPDAARDAAKTPPAPPAIAPAPEAPPVEPVAVDRSSITANAEKPAASAE